MMDTVGYAMIRKSPTSRVWGISADKFTDGPVRVLEFASDGGVLVLDSAATGLCMFDKEDVLQSFRCVVHGGQYICPPYVGFVEQMIYVGRCVNRKGGYGSIIKQIVVLNSLRKGEFDDGLIWVVEEEENRAKAAQP